MRIFFAVSRRHFPENIFVHIFYNNGAVITHEAKKLKQLLRNGELNPGARYRNENISLMDIKRANSQH